MLNRPVRIDFAKHAHVGPGKIELLEAIRHAGSLSQAARDLGISYRHAWQLAESLKCAFQAPVTLATRGGNGGGGNCLTGFG
jgi:molybdate transport system regulatory protein